MPNIYFKHTLPYNEINLKLNEKEYKGINIYIDLLSVNKTFFSVSTIKKEFEDKGKNKFFINDLKDYINTIYNKFKDSYEVKFVLFFDRGGSLQNKKISPIYKENRKDMFLDLIKSGKITDEESKYYSKLKKTNLDDILKYFNIKNTVYTIDFENYEADLVAHYCISKNLLNSNEKLNLIVSNDKDLLQTCRYNNVMQIMYIYSNFTSNTICYTKTNACQQIIKDEKRTKLPAEYIPLLLSIGGDTSDNVLNVPKIGYKKAYDFIVKKNIPYIIHESEKSIFSTFENYEDLIINNYKITDFDEQITRLPDNIIEKFKNII